MSGRILDFSQYIGGADNVKVIELFPKSQKAYTYGFGQDVSTYTFSADVQTIVLDQVSYDRTTGEPNFADTLVIGYLPNTANIDANTYIDTSLAASGNVTFTIPAESYTGNITPSTRTNVVMSVVSFEWTTADTPVQVDLHRWAILERWEPGVTPGSPLDEPTYVSLV